MPTSAAADFLVIGAGIAGAAAAYELAAHGRVLLLERESQPGYHSTGRSAALYTETYGNATMRALTTASKAFFRAPPAGFAAPLLTARGTLLVARADQRAALEQAFNECSALVGNLSMWTGSQVRARVAAFTAEQVDAALWEPDAMDIDVHALHQGYLRGLRACGGQIVCDAEVLALSFASGQWNAQTRAAAYAAPIVVNAGGAWADEIGALAGACRIGLVPKRRTAITFDAPAGVALHDWPAVIDVDEQWYFKPDAARLLASPADETPSPPCDAQPDEYDVAVLVDRLANATTLMVPRIHAKWAGLRSFVADKTLVAGFDPLRPGFFWLAGQGGYGIQTAPAAGRIAAALVRGLSLPVDVLDLGVAAGDVAPDRRALTQSPAE